MFDEDAFKKIDNEKLKIISKLFNDMKDRDSNERLQVLFSYGMEMKSKGLKFTKEESSLIVELLTVNLTEQDKTKMDMIANLLKSM